VQERISNNNLVSVGSWDHNPSVRPKARQDKCANRVWALGGVRENHEHACRIIHVACHPGQHSLEGFRQTVCGLLRADHKRKRTCTIVEGRGLCLMLEPKKHSREQVGRDCYFELLDLCLSELARRNPQTMMIRVSAWQHVQTVSVYASSLPTSIARDPADQTCFLVRPGRNVRDKILAACRTARLARFDNALRT